MADDGQERKGDNRGGDRRANDRRRLERRAPPPPWRRPGAFAAYGAVGVLALVLALRGCGDDEAPVPTGPIAPAPPTIATTPVAPHQGPVEQALRTADFERLTLEGERARGRIVQAQLYCDTPTPVALSTSSDTVEAAIAPLVDRATSRVPGATCLWGAQDDARREEFLLLVPPDLAQQFTSEPVTLDGYIRRRKVIANVEWIGKSRALALQTVGIFRGLSR
ncbi:MAG TPA: hypothetical protein VM890_11030 [Longimicrobium sp.]|jgi:hypothetical protein|nr:hypothetical protein [Longimicrobium sp.]